MQRKFSGYKIGKYPQFHQLKYYNQLKTLNNNSGIVFAVLRFDVLIDRNLRLQEIIFGSLLWIVENLLKQLE